MKYLLLLFIALLLGCHNKKFIREQSIRYCKDKGGVEYIQYFESGGSMTICKSGHRVFDIENMEF